MGDEDREVPDQADPLLPAGRAQRLPLLLQFPLHVALEENLVLVGPPRDFQRFGPAGPQRDVPLGPGVGVGLLDGREKGEVVEPDRLLLSKCLEGGAVLGPGIPEERRGGGAQSRLAIGPGLAEVHATGLGRRGARQVGFREPAFLGQTLQA